MSDEADVKLRALDIVQECLALVRDIAEVEGSRGPLPRHAVVGLIRNAAPNSISSDDIKTALQQAGYKSVGKRSIHAALLRHPNIDRLGAGYYRWVEAVPE